MSLFEEFESGVGTYSKVIHFAVPLNPDGFVILYLRPGGRFLFLGYWRGYERTFVAGQWSRRELEVCLEGRGQVCTDTVPGSEVREFARVLSIGAENHTPTLTATAELKGWSLLSWTGPFTYVGQTTVIEPDGQWLPATLAEVDAWIEKVVDG